MKLWEMSLTGALMVCMVLAVRAVSMRRIPARIFLVFWMIAMARFLVPVYLPVRLPDFQEPVDRITSEIPAITEENRAPETVKEAAGESPVTQNVEKENGIIREFLSREGFTVVWAAGMFLAAVWFLLSYLMHERRIREALPAEEWEAVRTWKIRKKDREKFAIVYTDYYGLPFSTGIWRKKIVLTKEMETMDPEKLHYILEHEAVHLNRMDGLWKLAGIVTVCVHWFNPLAWVMLTKLEEDLEISCDQQVTRALGTQEKKQYAKTLLAMEQGNPLPFLTNGFGGRRMKRRIQCILTETRSRILSVGILVAGSVFLTGCMGIFQEGGSGETDTDDQLVLQQLAGKLDQGTEIVYSNPERADRAKVMVESGSSESWLMEIKNLLLDQSISSHRFYLQPDVYGVLADDPEEDLIFINGFEIRVSFLEPQPFRVGCVNAQTEQWIFQEIYRMEEIPDAETVYTIPVEFPEAGVYTVYIQNLGDEDLQMDELIVNLGQLDEESEDDL